MIKRFRSHWFYWYTGKKPIALTSMVASAALIWGVLLVTTGASLFGVICAVLMDAAGIALILFYLVFVRTYVEIDGLVATHLGAPILMGLIVTRFVTFAVAKAFGERFESKMQTPRQRLSWP